MADACYATRTTAMAGAAEGGAASAAEGLRRAQLEALEDQGWVVKNTFITDGTGSAARPHRAHSAPPAGSRRHSAERPEDCSQPQPQQPPRQQQRQEDDDEPAGGAVARKPDRKLSSNTAASTKVPAADMTSSEASYEAEEASSELYDVIKQECGFLRIEGYVIHETKKVGKRGAEGTDTCLRIFCVGLPRVKRSRWLRPLLWLTANTLERAGLSPALKSCGLFLRCPRSGSLLRIDFSAARAGAPDSGSSASAAAEGEGETDGDACPL